MLRAIKHSDKRWYINVLSQLICTTLKILISAVSRELGRVEAWQFWGGYCDTVKMSRTAAYWLCCQLLFSRSKIHFQSQLVYLGFRLKHPFHLLLFTVLLNANKLMQHWQGTSTNMMLWPPLSYILWLHVTDGWHSAASATLHTARTIYKHLHPYHLSCISVVFVQDLREVLSICLVPPACTSATGVTLKNAFDKYIADVAFCCWTEAVCMTVWTDKPTLATLAGSKHWSFTEAATNTPSLCIEDVIYVTCQLAQGPTGLFFFTVSGQLWMYRLHIARILCL